MEIKKEGPKKPAKRDLENSEKKEQGLDENKERDKRFNTQLYWTFITIALMVLIFIGTYYYFSGVNNIRYNGLTFAREKFGEIPVFHYYYYITPQIKYNLYLRNNPATNNVPVTGDAIDKGIEFFKSDPVYVSLSPEGLVGCEYSSVGISSLATFLTDNQLKAKSATTDKEQAQLNNVSYATCEHNPGGTVIILRGGNSTQIIEETANCFIIEIADCEVLPAIEKFEVQAILDAKERRESGAKVNIPKT